MIPKKFVTGNLQKAATCRISGGFDGMTRDELIACVIAGWGAYENHLQESKRRRGFLNEMLAVKP